MFWIGGMQTWQLASMLKDCRLQKSETKNSDFPYRQAVGALMYLMVGTRPDLAYSVGFLSRSRKTHPQKDIVKIERVFRIPI
ncbi:hypothetical protein TNCV_4651951 [Trichonephila clavipes]|nr:hypothetical protein TNCV_4651951 [Trichonephila clavipes]